MAAPKPQGATEKPPKHALVKVLLAPVAVVKKGPVFFSKATLYTFLFGTEAVVDGARVGLEGADKVFAAISIKGKVPVLDSISAFVSVGAKDAGKLDGWLERQEKGLFGTSN
jgi:hypothetical protein